MNCLCDPLQEKHCNCVAKLQCEVDWPWLQLIVDCGEAVTILDDCVVWSNSVVSGMTWCAVCSYYSSFIEGFIRVSVPCDSRSLSGDCLAASILKWVTADVCKGLWVSNGWPVVVACVVATRPKQFRGCVVTEDLNLTEGGRLEVTQMWTKAPKVSERQIVSGLADSCFFVCCCDVTVVASRLCSLQVA